MLTMLFSCTTDDTVTVLSSRAYISNVQLGAVKRLTYYINSEGERVPIVTTYKATDIVMSISQRRDTVWVNDSTYVLSRLIENKDSLICGSRLNAVLLDISYAGSYVAYRKAGDKDALWIPYSNTDSINLTSPIEICVNSEDYLSGTYYTLRINVHQVEGDSMVWRKVATAEELLAPMSGTQAFTLKGEACLLGVQPDGIYKAYHEADSVWKKDKTNLPENVQLNTLRDLDDKLFITTTDGSLYQSTDGLMWTAFGTQLPGMQLAAVTKERLYAISNGNLWRSNHTAQAWEQESTYESDRKALPTNVVEGFTYERANGVQHVVLMGYNKAVSDTACVVWDKTWDALSSADNAAWLYYEVGKDNTFTCPLIEHLQVVNYDGRLYAFGGKAIKGWNGWVPMEKALYSLDYGLTWRTEKMWSLPSQLKGFEGLITATVDKNNYLWITAGNEIWRGRINRLAPGF